MNKSLLLVTLLIGSQAHSSLINSALRTSAPVDHALQIKLTSDQLARATTPTGERMLNFFKHNPLTATSIITLAAIPVMFVVAAITIECRDLAHRKEAETTLKEVKPTIHITPVQAPNGAKKPKKERKKSFDKVMQELDRDLSQSIKPTSVPTRINTRYFAD